LIRSNFLGFSLFDPIISPDSGEEKDISNGWVTDARGDKGNMRCQLFQWFEAGFASYRFEASAVATSQQHREVPAGSLRRFLLPARHARHADERTGSFRKVAKRFRC